MNGNLDRAGGGRVWRLRLSDGLTAAVRVTKVSDRGAHRRLRTSRRSRPSSLPDLILAAGATIDRNLIIARETGQPLEKVERDTDRNYWMSAEEAVAYGMVGRIITDLKAL